MFFDQSKISELRELTPGKFVFSGKHNKIIKAMKEAFGVSSNNGEDTGASPFCRFIYEGGIVGFPGIYRAKLLEWEVDSQMTSFSQEKAGEPLPEDEGDLMILFPGEIGGLSHAVSVGSFGYGYVVGQTESEVPIVLAFERKEFLGKIVLEGPNGQNNFSDERYWVKLHHITSSPESPLVLSNLEADQASFDNIDGSQENGTSIVCVHNLSEHSNHSHTLPKDLPVKVVSYWSPSGELVYAMEAGDRSLQAVRVKKVSGEAGGPIEGSDPVELVYASFVYDLFPLTGPIDSSSRIAESVPFHYRLLPTVMKFAPDGSIAMAAYSNGSWELLTIAEQADGYNVCPS